MTYIKVTFLSNVLEKVILSQLVPYLVVNALIDVFQSGLGPFILQNLASLTIFYWQLTLDTGASQ